MGALSRIHWLAAEVPSVPFASPLGSIGSGRGNSGGPGQVLVNYAA